MTSVSTEPASAPQSPEAPRDGDVRPWDIRFIITIVVLSVVICCLRFRGPLDLRYDAGVYYILGTSLAHGNGYRLLNEPGDPQAVQYPPLLPAIVATHVKLVGSDDMSVVGPWLRLTFFLMTTALLVAVYVMARRWLSPHYAFAVVFILSLLHWTTFCSEFCMADLPFALASVVFVILHDRPGKWNQTIAALLAVASYLLRTMGIALLIGWIAEAIFRRQWKQTAIRAVISVIPVIAWQGYVAHVRHGIEYAHPTYAYQRAPYQYYNVSYSENLSLYDPFYPEKGKATPTRIAKRFFSNLKHIPTSLGESVSQPYQYWAYILGHWEKFIQKTLRINYYWEIVPWCIGWLVIAALALFAVKRQWMILLYLVGTVGLICLTPWPAQFVRYLWPCAPFIVTAMVMGAAFVVQLVERKRPDWKKTAQYLALAAGAFIVLSELYTLLHVYKYRGTIEYSTPSGELKTYKGLFWDPSWRSFDKSLFWLKDQAKRGEIVVASAPHWTYLRTGLKSVQPPFVQDPDEALKLIDDVGATYLIADAFQYPGGDVSQRYAEPMLAAHPEAWKEIYNTPLKDKRAALKIYRRVGK